MFGLHRRVRIAYPSGKMTFPIIFGVFFETALREASETRFFWISNDFGLPGDDHLAPKSHKKKRPKKGSKTGMRVMQVTGCGSFKTDKHQTSDHKKDDPNTPWRAWRHGGGYIYIYRRLGG